MVNHYSENNAKVENNTEKREWLAPKLIDEVVEKTENGVDPRHREGLGPTFPSYVS